MTIRRLSKIASYGSTTTHVFGNALLLGKNKKFYWLRIGALNIIWDKWSIIGPASAERWVVQDQAANVLKVSPLFLNDMLPALWEAAFTHGIDPVGMIAQSYKETGGGTFRGNVKPWFCNTAGIKVKNVNEVMAILGTTNVDHPLVHQQFPNWRVGAWAHAQHLWAYTGMPLDDMIVDPRYTYAKKGPANWAENFSDLSQKWAVPGVGYGEDIERIARILQGR